MSYETDFEQEVDWSDELAEWVGSQEGVVFTSYFSTTEDAQSRYKRQRQRVRPRDISYIQALYSSCQLHNLALLVFVDDSSQEMQVWTRQWERPNIKFIFVPRSGLSANDDRFLAYREVLKRLPDQLPILLADASDVLIKQSPWQYIADAPGLVFGEDASHVIRLNEHTSGQFDEIVSAGLLGQSEAETIKVGFMVNAGVIGGFSSSLLDFLNDVTLLIRAWGGIVFNINMPAVNAIANVTEHPIWIGKPFSSAFGAWEIEADYYVIHK